MSRKITFFMMLITLSVHSQTFTGSTGAITDDGIANNYTAEVTGLTAPVTTSYGLVQVCLDITHTWDSDLNVQLISPDGTIISLFTGLGGADDNYTGTCFSQDAETVISTAWAPFTGTYKPEETLGNHNNGQEGNGVWTLRILDTYAWADTGTLNSWSITFGANAPAPFVFQSSNLPIVILNTNGVAIPDDPKIDATMAIIYNGEGQVNYLTDTPTEYNGNIGIELRGNYSQSLPQKPYKFETRDAEGEELNVGLLDMPSEHDWCLIANYNDKVFMRNTFAYSLFTDMGHYAARSRYCEVVLNGSYMGVYMLMESLKRDNDRIDIAKLEDDENSGLDLTGGYILKSDYWTEEDSWQLQHHPIGHPDFNVRLVYEYPKPEDITDEQKTYIQTFVNDFENALYGDNFADPINGYAKYIDVDSFIDYFIVNELSRNIDGFRKSFFFHKDKDESETEISKLKAGPVWDFDWAWKDIWSCAIFEATDGSGWAHQINDCWPDVASPGWHIRLLEDPVFANRLRCRWEYFRSEFLSDEAIETYIDSVATYLDESQARHFEKWGNLGFNTGTPEVQPDPDTFDGQIAQFKNWISLRVEWLDANIPGTTENCSLIADAATPELVKSLVYPIPAHDVVYINLPDIELAQVELFDVSGKCILKTKISEDGSLNVSVLANGIYMCKVVYANIQSTIKIAVQH